MKFRAVHRNTDVTEFEVDNPFISWFVVDTPKGRIVYMPDMSDLGGKDE